MQKYIFRKEILDYKQVRKGVFDTSKKRTVVLKYDDEEVIQRA